MQAPRSPLGITVRELDRAFLGRLDDAREHPAASSSARSIRPGPAYAVLRRGLVIMEINRQPDADGRRLRVASSPRPGRETSWPSTTTIRPRAAQPRDRHGRVSSARSMKARILVVDDEAEIRRSVRMILEYEGYEVLEASSGPDGIAIAERETPDLVFLDIKMPGMDGLDVLQRLRALNEALPVVIISGHGTVEHRGRSDQGGRLRLHREAADDRARAGHDPQRARSDAARATRTGRSSAPSKSRHQMVGESPALRQVWDAIRRAVADQRDRAAARRERRRQGTGRARRSIATACAAASASCRSTARRFPRS